MALRFSVYGRRLLVAVAAVLVLGYGGYLGSANLFLSTSLADRVINRKPERLRLTWSSARTWWPGSVVLDGVRIEGRNREFDWQASLDHVWVHLSLWRLPARVLQTERIDGRGLEFRLWDRQQDVPREGGRPVELAGQADDAGGTDVAGQVDAAGETPGRPVRESGAATRRGGTRELDDTAERPAPVRRRARRPWRLDLQGIRISDVREISIGKSTLHGSGDLRGGLGLELRGPLRFDGLALSFIGARLLQSGEPVAEDVAFAVKLTASPFEPGEDSTREILAGVSGDVALTADVHSIGALELLLRKPDWLSFSGGGRLDTTFRIDEGEVLPGGHLDFAASTLEARVLDWTAEGDGTIAVRLPESGEPAAVLDVDFGRFTVRRGDHAAAHVHGQNLRVAVEARALDLATGFEGIDLRVDVPPSRVDFVAYNSYLPPKAFRIERGQGTVRSWFEYSDDDGRGRGEVAIDVTGASGFAGDLAVEGDLALRTVIRGGDFDALRFDVSGSTLALRNVRLARPGGKVESEGWWATLDTERARVDMKEPLEAEIVMRGRLRDAKPFLTALASRRKTLFWLDDLIGVRDVEGRASIDIDHDTLAARDVVITGDKLEIVGDVGTRDGAREGLLYLKYGPFSAALEIARGERDWKLFHSRRWFEERRRARAALAGSAS